MQNKSSKLSKIFFRVRLNGSWFDSHNKVLNFHNWTLCYHELFHDNRNKEISVDLAIDLWHSNNMKVILLKFAKDHCFWTFWTLNYVDCLFLALVLSLFSSIKPNKLRKFYSWTSKKHDHLCGRHPIKSFLFLCPSACLSVLLWHIFLRIYSVGFRNFFHEDILPYLPKIDKARFWKIVFVF